MALAAAAAAAAAAGASKSVFDYNRENFLEDREQRMKKEFAERKFRIVQAELWREDVRDFVSLTERKMSIYLLVNVLMLGFTFNLWCEGRLPEEETPEWLLMGNQLATVGAFSFLLLTVWLAMHASVAARSYQTRVLTQLVRLPIPSWEELEACRTYASEFEKVEPMQMFRIPFLMRRQEDIARRAACQSATAQQASAGGDPEEWPEAWQNGTPPRSGGSAEPAVATDPWGLERRSEDIYELGCHIGSDVAKLRHIKIMRQAAVYWQTYDAFARVSMSIGVNQLMLAMSYYIQGYAIIEVRAPIAGFAGVIILICCAAIVAQIDLTLPHLQRLMMQVLLLCGPSISCLATFHAFQRTEMGRRVAECLAPVAFLAHGVVIVLLAMVVRVREQENGAMLPLAFQGVLFLDVFGWVWHKHTVPTVSSEAGSGVPTSPTSLSGSLTPRSAASATPNESSRRPKKSRLHVPRNIGNFMAGPLDPSYDLEGAGETAGHVQPALASVA